MGDYLRAKRTWKYIKYTMNYKLHYGLKDPKMKTYTDSDWASDSNSRRSMSGFVIMMFGAAISWKSKLQPTVALSTSEAEYMAMTTGAQELLWIDMFLGELGLEDLKQTKPLIMYGDNQGALKMAQEGADTPRAKHIDIKFHFLKDLVVNGVVDVTYIDTNHNLADLMTKGKPKQPHHHNTKVVLGLKDGVT